MEKRIFAFLGSLLLCVGMAMAQTQVRGTIISADDGEPLPGAAIKVVGTTTGTTTNINGQFTITVPSADSRLEISHMGMLPRVVRARNGMQIALDTDNRMLDEVMVIAYGTAKRSTFTGSAVEIKSEDITNHVSASATSALIGKVTGLQALGVGEGPGSTPSFKIRGIGSLGASSAPLYIIDGAPLEQSASTINPNDIESISVLKDASASAIYGARGANGVIIITTKKAKGVQDAEVTFDAKWGSNSRLIPNYDVVTDPAAHYELYFKSLYNSRLYHGSTPDQAYDYANSHLFSDLGYQVYTLPQGENLIGRNFKINPNATLGYSDGVNYFTPDDWYDETYHNSFRQEYNVSVNGGTGRLSYFASAGYLNDGGYVSNSRYQRYTSRANVEYQAKKWLRLSTNFSFTHSDSETPEYSDNWGSSGNLFYITNIIAPIYPLYVRNADGSIRVDNGVTIYDTNQTGFSRPGIVGNAVRDNEYNRNHGNSDIFNGKWAAVITPVKGLELSAIMSASAYNNRSTSLSSRFASGSTVDGAVQVSHSRNFSVNQIYQGNYIASFGDHNVSALAGYERYRLRSSSLSGYNDHLYNPYIAELNNAYGVDFRSAGSATDNLARQGYFGRLSYDYGERYFADVTVRREASSIFAPGHRWGTFGSAGIGWQINKEAFLKDVTWIDLLKLKASWGSTGNDNLGYYAWADRYTPSYNNETGEYSITLSSKGNTELTWEKKKSWNFGLDFSLFKYRLNGSIEAYFGNTTDMLYSRTLPLSSGVNARTYPVNVGRLFNSGIEFSLDADVVRTRDFKWNVNLMLAHNHNEIKELDPTIPADGLKYSNQILIVGGSAREAYMKQYAGTYGGSYTGSEYSLDAYKYDFQPGQALFYKDEVQLREVLEAVVDDSGNPVLDADGNPTYQTAHDANGNIRYEQVTDENDNPVYTGRKVVTNALDEATSYDCGDMLPKVIGGFGTTIEAFGFDLSAQFSFQLGGKYYDGGYQSIMRNGISAAQVMHKDLYNAWSEDNPTSDIPRLSNLAADDPCAQTSIDRFLISSNYLSLNNLTLGYTFPKKWMTPLTVRSLRVFVAGENLFLLTKRQGIDPRFTDAVGSMTTGGGLATGMFSTMRTITAGLTVKF